jgi:hypothetical protein
MRVEQSEVLAGAGQGGCSVVRGAHVAAQELTQKVTDRMLPSKVTELADRPNSEFEQ